MLSLDLINQPEVNNTISDMWYITWKLVSRDYCNEYFIGNICICIILFDNRITELIFIPYDDYNKSKNSIYNLFMQFIVNVQHNIYILHMYVCTYNVHCVDNKIYIRKLDNQIPSPNNSSHKLYGTVPDHIFAMISHIEESPKMKKRNLRNYTQYQNGNRLILFIIQFIIYVYKIIANNEGLSWKSWMQFRFILKIFVPKNWHAWYPKKWFYKRSRGGLIFHFPYIGTLKVKKFNSLTCFYIGISTID